MRNVPRAVADVAPGGRALAAEEQLYCRIESCKRGYCTVGERWRMHEAGSMTSRPERRT